MRNVNRVREVRLEDVVRVSFDTMEKVIVSGVEQVGDDRHVIVTVTEPFATAQQRVESRAVSNRAHARPRRSTGGVQKNSSSSSFSKGTNSITNNIAPQYRKLSQCCCNITTQLQQKTSSTQCMHGSITLLYGIPERPSCKYYRILLDSLTS